MRRLTAPLVVFLVLLLLTVWRELGRHGSDAPVDAQPVRLAAATFTLEDVVRIRVGRGDGQFEIVPTARGGFEVTAPFRAPAAPGRVRRLVELLSAGEAEPRTTDDTLASEFQLTEAQSVPVRVLGEGGAVLAAVEVGSTSGPSGAFVRRTDGNENRILATSLDLRGALGLPVVRGGADPTPASAAAFHDTAFPGRALPDARRLTLSVPGRELVVERETRTWELREGAAPAPLRVEGVRQVLHLLEGALVIDGLVAPEESGALDFANSGYVTQVERQGGATVRVEGVHVADVERGENRYYARLTALRDPEVVWRLGPAAFKQLFPDGEQVVALATLRPPIVPAQVFSVGVTHGDPARTWTASRLPATRWGLDTPEIALESDPLAITQVVAEFARLTPIDWLTGDAEGPRSPLRIRMGYEGPDSEGPAPGLEHLGVAPELRGVALQSSWAKEPLVYRLTDLARVQPRVLDLVRRHPLERWIPEDLRALSRIEPDGATSYALVRESGEWRDGDEAIDTERLTAWIRRLITLEVQEIGGELTAPGPALLMRRKGGVELHVRTGSDAEGRPVIAIGEDVFLVAEAPTLLTAEQLREEP